MEKMKNKEVYSKKEIEVAIEKTFVPKPKRMLGLPVEMSKEERQSFQDYLKDNFFHNLNRIKSEKVYR